MAETRIVEQNQVDVPKRNFLILKSAKDICGDEMGSLEHYTRLIGMQVFTDEVLNEASLDYIVTKYKNEEIVFDFIYLCAHGTKAGFDTDLEGPALLIPWSKFGQIYCENGILNDNTIFLLACCQGGLMQVATDIMAVCNKINYVCGVKWSVKKWDLTTGFIVFLHNLVNKDAEPSYAATKASLATDYIFACHDRDDIEMLPQFINRQNELYYELGWIGDDGETIIDDPTILENTGLPKPGKADDSVVAQPSRTLA